MDRSHRKFDKLPIQPDIHAALREMTETTKPTIEAVRKQLTQILLERLQTDWEAYEKEDKPFAFDHYILALGDPLVGENKHLLDKRFIHRFEKGPLFFGDNYHVGNISYALLRAQVDAKKRVSVPGQKTMTIEQLIFYPLEHIEEESLGNYETEWLVLLAVESLKRGRKTQIKLHNGSEKKLEDLVQICRYEFHQTVNPNSLNDEEKKQTTNYRGTTCKGLHALHAIVAYAVLQNDNAQINTYCDIIFSIIEHLKKVKAGRPRVTDGPRNSIDYIAHLLTPLTELPVNYPLNADQKALMKWAVDELIKQIESFADVPVIELSHALDVLKHIPDEWVR